MEPSTQCADPQCPTGRFARARRPQPVDTCLPVFRPHRRCPSLSRQNSRASPSAPQGAGEASEAGAATRSGSSAAQARTCGPPLEMPTSRAARGPAPRISPTHPPRSRAPTAPAEVRTRHSRVARFSWLAAHATRHRPGAAPSYVRRRRTGDRGGGEEGGGGERDPESGGAAGGERGDDGGRDSQAETGGKLEPRASARPSACSGAVYGISLQIPGAESGTVWVALGWTRGQLLKPTGESLPYMGVKVPGAARGNAGHNTVKGLLRDAGRSCDWRSAEAEWEHRVGIAHHLGWAVAVTASAGHVVVDRRRIELIEPDMPAAPVEHEAKHLDDDDAARMVAEVRASALRTTPASLDQLASSLPGPVASMSLRAWLLDFPDDIAVQRRPPWLGGPPLDAASRWLISQIDAGSH